MTDTRTRVADRLNESHLGVHLNESAISEDVLAERGCYTVTKRAELLHAGFSNPQIKPGGVMYPVWKVDGEKAFYLYRADDPRIVRGKPAKYEFPPGQQMAIDVPKRCRKNIDDPAVPLYITEGIKKADSGASRGLCVIDIIGVWNWRGTNQKGGKTALPEFENIAWKDGNDASRTVYLAFDSDIMDKRPVYQALQRLRELLKKKGADVWVVYLPDGKGGKKVGLDDFFAAGGTVEELRGYAQKELKLPSWDAMRKDHVHVVDAVEGIPTSPQLVVPPGYELTPGGVLEIRMSEALEERQTMVAPAPIVISGRTSDVHDGKEAAELLYKRGEQWQRRTAPRSAIANTRDVVALADYGVPVNSGNAKELVKYLSEFDTANIEGLPHGKTSARMGWQGRQGSDGFLWGKRLLRAGQAIPETGIEIEELRPEDWPEDGVMFRGADNGDEQLAAGFAASGSLAGWQEIMKTVECFERIKLVVTASLATPLLEVLDAHNFIVDISNPTSRGKTVTLRIAASCWGNPDERSTESVLGTWDATRVYIERASAALNNLPLILDDTKRARHPKVVAQTLYDLHSGKGRGRGSKEGLGRSGSWSTILISTGEQPATSFTEDGGTRARVLTLWGSPFDVVSEEVAKLVGKVDLEVRENFGQAGPQFVQHLLDRRDEWPQYREKHKRYKRGYIEKAAGDAILGRMADYFATLKLAAEIATHASILPWTPFDPVEPVWDTLAGEVAESDRAEAALKLVLSWAVTNQRTFWGRHGEDMNCDPIPPSQGYSGRWDKDCQWSTEREFLGFSPHCLKALLKKEDHDYESTIRTWRDRDWLLLTYEGAKVRNTWRTYIEGERTRVIAIKREIVDLFSGSDDCDD